MSDAESSSSGESTDPAAATSAAEQRIGVAVPTRGLRIARALLAPILVLGAVGVHFSLNVPDEKVVMPKKGKKAKAKRGGRGGARARVERTEAQMDKAWERWKDERYDSETIKGKWGRRMQSTLNKAVVVARKEAFKGAPEDPRVVVSGTQCRTVRCSFILRSPYEHEPGLVVEALKRQRYDGEPLWRVVEATPTDPPNQHSPKKDHYLRVMVGVSVDALDTRDIGFVAEKGSEKRSPAGGAQEGRAVGVKPVGGNG